MARIAKRPAAELDLEDVFVYLARRSPRAADRFLQAAERAVNNLAEMPGLGGHFESRHPVLAELRVWPIPRFRKYVILYRELPDGIEVVRVLHSARDIEGLMRRGD